MNVLYVKLIGNRKSSTLHKKEIIEFLTLVTDKNFCIIDGRESIEDKKEGD